MYRSIEFVITYLEKICDLESCQIIQEEESVKKKCKLDI